MFASSLETLAAFLGVLTPLVAAPLTVIVFYLRSLREHQVSWHEEFIRRVDVVEASTGSLRETLREFERDYTTKEEWLRECMHARHILEQLRDATVRIEASAYAQPRTGDETRRGVAAPSGSSPVGPFRCIRPMDGNEGVD
ncbi:MAG: hypothetical protein JSU63_18970 [Phycisphaerales bacterium]|nr:MAG: hypothetical protein JSU63_18970 [Phycisphaerales bacterium]